VTGTFINGSAGEGVSLSQKEKITEIWVAQRKQHYYTAPLYL